MLIFLCFSVGTINDGFYMKIDPTARARNQKVTCPLGLGLPGGASKQHAEG
jgi:hypothetical protein